MFECFTFSIYIYFNLLKNILLVRGDWSWSSSSFCKGLEVFTRVREKISVKDGGSIDDRTEHHGVKSKRTNIKIQLT